MVALSQYLIEERMKIEIHKRPDGLWQADCDNDHSLGDTPGDAVDRLVAYIGQVGRMSRVRVGNYAAQSLLDTTE